MSETISKASVCEILSDIYPTDGEKFVAVKEVDKAYEAIQQLPSAQPELGENSPSEQPKTNELGVKTGATCTDTISRQAAMDAFASLIPYVIDDALSEAYVHGLSDGYAVICNLPSVQASCKQVTGKLDKRKTGEWIDREHCQVDEDGYDVAFCSVCGQEVTLAPWGDAFCPCCGSYNGG